MDKIHDELTFIEQIIKHADYMIEKGFAVLRMYDNYGIKDCNYGEWIEYVRAYMNIKLMCYDILEDKYGIITEES